MGAWELIRVLRDQEGKNSEKHRFLFFFFTLQHCIKTLRVKIHYTHHHIRYTLVITISQKKQFPRRRQVSLICATIYLPLSTKSQLASTVMKKGPVIPGLYVTGMIVYTSSFGSTSRKNPSGVEISWIGTKPVIVQGTFWW